MPSPTAPEITPPDAVFEIGEWWKTESIWVRIPELEITDHGLIYIKMDFWNKSDQDLLFSWSVPKNISMVDNTGHVYARYDFINRHDISQRVNSDALLSLDSGYGCAVVYEDYNYFDVAVTGLYLTITDLSRLSHAEFHILVPK